MKKYLRVILILTVMSYIFITNAFALNVGQFGYDTEKGKITIEQAAKGLKVITKYGSDGGARNLRLMMKSPLPAKINYSIDKNEYGNSGQGYMYLAFFADADTTEATKQSAGIGVMMWPYVNAEQENMDKHGKKTVIYIQTIKGTKIHEQQTYDGNIQPIDAGWIIDSDYVGNHTLTVDVAKSQVIVDGTKIPVNKAALQREGYGTHYDLFIQTGGTTYGKTFEYTIKDINGTKVDGTPKKVTGALPVYQNGQPVGDGWETTSSTTSKATSSQTGAVTSSVSENTSSIVSDSATEPSESTEPDITSTEEPTQSSIVTLNADIIKPKYTDVSIDYNKNTVSLERILTCKELKESVITGEGYTFNIIDKNGNAINDDAKKIDDSMKVKLSGTENSFELSIITADESSSDSDNTILFVVIGIILGVLVLLAAVYFILVKLGKVPNVFAKK